MIGIGLILEGSGSCGQPSLVYVSYPFFGVGPDWNSKGTTHFEDGKPARVLVAELLLGISPGLILYCRFMSGLARKSLSLFVRHLKEYPQKYKVQELTE